MEKDYSVVPIRKTNRTRKIELDLRPISLASTLPKVLESTVSGWILEAVKDKLDKQQFLKLNGAPQHTRWSTFFTNGTKLQITVN
jgi:hypothetical protein